MSCPHDGILVCGGVPLSQYDSLSADELYALSFEPKNENTIFRAELFAFGTDFSKDITLIISNCENPKIVSADIPAWKYNWEWAKNRYFSFIYPKCL